MTSPIAAELRQSRTIAADRIGIDRAYIDQLVEHFYALVRADPMLAPHFAARVDDWPPHLARMKDFWTLVLRGEGAFHGNPMLKHIALPAIGTADFDRWLDLFAQAANGLAENPAAAQIVIDRAQAIAASLLAGIRRHRAGDGHRAAPLPRKGESHA
jgi:hemoglobin